jgi:TonB family protein
MIEVQKYLEGQIVDGRYPLIEHLGTTEHSSVFRTECAEAGNHQAAIKLIPAPAATSGAQLTRWRLAARFSHPALLRIFDMGRCDFEGRAMLYVVMELAEENLGDILPVRSLSPGELGALLGPTLDALSYLHSKGFVHGHLRPSNILAIGDQVKLSSDSIARIGEAADARDPADLYSAPEVDLSAATDIWSLGVATVQCLTGRVPERAAGGRHSLSIPPDVPAPFLDLARHCVNPVPPRRWSVAQIRDALAPGSSATAAPTAEPVADSIAESANLSGSAFVKPDAATPIRRTFQLKRKYRLALAGFAAAAAAFVFGIVISGSGPNNTVTASTSVTPAAAPSQPSAPTQDAQPSTALQRRRDEHRDIGKDSRDFDSRGSKVSLGDESPHREFARADNSAPAVIISKAAPGVPAQLAAPASGDVVSGAVARRALPRVPESASNTITGTVKVSVVVDVDPRGRVVQAKLDEPGPSRYFARLSMAAAPDWKFTPPRVKGQIVASEWVINFGYSQADTSASATERHP